MYIAIIKFPPVKPGKDEEFREWFIWANRQFASFRGFIGRRLLKPEKGDTYTVLAEFESREAFAEIQASPVHDEAGKRVVPLLEGAPAPEFFELLMG